MESLREGHLDEILEPSVNEVINNTSIHPILMLHPLIH